LSNNRYLPNGVITEQEAEAQLLLASQQAKRDALQSELHELYNQQPAPGERASTTSARQTRISELQTIVQYLNYTIQEHGGK
jgi:uncharacterized membrane protein YqiK